MKTTPLFYSLYQITLEVTRISSDKNTCLDSSWENTLEKELEKATIRTFDCFAHLRSLYKDGLSLDQHKYYFSKDFKDKDLVFKNGKEENSFLEEVHSFCKNVGMREFYIFRYKMRIFVLLVGETIIFSSWHTKISQSFHKILNQIILSNKIKNLLNNKPELTPAHMGLRDSAALTNPDNPEGCQRFVKGSVEICFSFDLKDHTYSEAKNPRRLRSLGGGLRRLLSKVKEKAKSLTNKNIIKDLVYSTISGDEQKLLTQISAVENNTKFNYQIKTKDLNLNDLPVDEFLLLVQDKVDQEYKSNDRMALLTGLEKIVIYSKKVMDQYGVSNQSPTLRT